MGGSALIGHTGFVGSNLARQIAFDAFYNSANINEIRNASFDCVVCAGIQAKKWWANQNEEQDWVGICSLMDHLETVSAKQFVLISTVDVYPKPCGVDEDSLIDPMSNHAYGKNRFFAEAFVQQQFQNHLILRLPGLFGDAIKKNVIHDLLYNHELEKINPGGVYQYYSLDALSADIKRATSRGLSLLNIATAAISTREISEMFFPEKVLAPETEFHAIYDMRSKYWKDWGSSAEGYLYNKKTVLAQLAEFVARQKR